MTTATHYQTHILREQDASSLIGRTFWTHTNHVVRVTGNDPVTGYVQIDGKINHWIGFDHLRESISVADITGLTNSKALIKIKKCFPHWCSTLKVKHIAMRMQSI